MGLIVKEALQLSGLEKAKIIAGKKGLKREIKYVTVFEVPDIIKWLKGGELLLTSGFAIPREEKKQQELISQFAAKGIAALAIKAGRFLSSIPRAMILAAEENDFPLLEFNHDVTYQEIITSVMTAIIQKDGEIVQEDNSLNPWSRNLKNIFIEDLLLNHIKSEAVAKKRLGLLGLTGQNYYTMATIRVQDKKDLQSSVDLVEERLKNKGHQVIVAGSNKLILLVAAQVGKEFYIREFALDLKEVMASMGKEPVAVGIGDTFTQLLDARKSYLQAEEAIEFALKYWGTDVCTFFADIGMYKLIYELGNMANIEDYIPKGLRNLFAYDRGQKTELVKTLHCYLDNGGNCQKTANELYIHYKTLQYRLKRITKITGLDLDSGEARLILHLALKIMDKKG